RGTVQRCCDPSARRWLAVAWWSVADIVLVGGSVLWPCSVGSRRLRRVRLRDSFITGFVATAWLVQVDGEVQLGPRGRPLAGGSLEWAIDQLQLVSSHRPGEALSRGVDQFHLFGHLAGGSLERGVDQPQLVGSHLPGETLHWTINQCCLSGGGLESELVGGRVEFREGGRNLFGDQAFSRGLNRQSPMLGTRHDARDLLLEILQNPHA